jgi:hypothetical protein
MRHKLAEAESSAQCARPSRVCASWSVTIMRRLGSAKNVLGMILKEMGHTGNEVVQAARDLLEKNRAVSGNKDVQTISSMMNLGMLLASKNVC